MPSVFTKIINGEIPCHKIAETDLFLAFLDIRPLAAGHTLVIPKVEVDYIFDLDDYLLSSLMLFAKKVSKAVEAAVPCKRIGLAVVGLEVPHVHIHLIPIENVQDMNFSRPPIKLSSDEFGVISEKIRAKSLVVDA
jgi:histidine triad (HIT) family protein